MAHEAKDISEFNEVDKPNTIALYVIGFLTLALLAATFIGLSAFKSFDDAKVEEIRLEKRRAAIAADDSVLTIEKLRKAQAADLKKINTTLEAFAKTDFIK